jgi:acyl carrier protein
MSTEVSVEETVRSIAGKILRKPDIVFNSKTTFKDFGADSLDIVQILVAVEDKYGIELDDEELKKLTDTAGFVEYIKGKVAKKAAQ